MKINEIYESTVAGSIATVAKPLGELQTRSEKPPKSPPVKKNKKKYANQISEGAVKELLHDLRHMDPEEFKTVYKKAKEFFTNKPVDVNPASKPVTPSSSKVGSKVWHDTGYVDKKAAKVDEPIQEDELKEDDLIILPGMIRNKDKSFVPKHADRRDHEVEMARSDVYAAAKDAMRIFKILENRSEDEGLMGWQQSYITLASDYLNSVADSLEYDSVANENALGKLVTKLAQYSAKDLPKTPEVQRAIANHAMNMEKNADRAAKVGTAAAGAVASKALYDKAKQKTQEGAGVIAGGMSNFEESENGSADFLRRLKQGPLTQNYKGSAAEQIILKGFMNSKSFPGKIDGTEWITAAKRWLNANKVFLQNRLPELDINDLQDLAEKMYEDFLAMQGQLEEGRPYNPSDYERREQAAMDAEKRDFKRRELEAELAGEEKYNNYAVHIDGRLWKIFSDKMKAQNIANSLRKKGKDVKVYLTGASPTAEGKGTTKFRIEVKDKSGKVVTAYNHTDEDYTLKNVLSDMKDFYKISKNNGQTMDLLINGKPVNWKELIAKQNVKEDKCPQCGGEMVSEELMNEKKDACYYKVKSRYKVWPSAYASGALVKCRKKGASNWGTGGKK